MDAMGIVNFIVSLQSLSLFFVCGLKIKLTITVTTKNLPFEQHIREFGYSFTQFEIYCVKNSILFGFFVVSKNCLLNVMNYSIGTIFFHSCKLKTFSAHICCK